MSLRVAMVTRDYPPRLGGVSTAVHALVQELIRLGVLVDVFEGLTNSGALLIPTRENLRSSKYDIIHVQNGPFGALVSRHPFVVTLHSTLLEEAKYYGAENRLRILLAYPLERLALQKADAIITDCRFISDAVEKGYGVRPEKVTTIPLGVDTVRFNPDSKTSLASRRILICSRLDPRKNIGGALHALSHLTESYELNIVGEGPEKSRLIAVNREKGTRGKFLGALSQDALQKIFSESGIFISSSRSEGFGLSVLQAMASGCAVVVSDIPSHRELVTHMRDGLIFSTKEELVSHLRSLLSDPGLTARLGEKARERALLLSWDKTAAEVACLYRTLLERHS